MKKQHIIIALAAVLSAGVISCKKSYFDINRTPNNVTESNITAELILPNALHNTGVQTALGYGFLQHYVGYWSPSGSFAPSTEESTYNLTTGFAEPKWNGIYNTLYDLHTAEVKATAANQPYYRGVAMIMKAHLFQNLVDLFGDVPYTEAFRSEIKTPKYDDAQTIYNDLQVKLDTAIAIMKAQPVAPNGSVIKTTDVVFQGNPGQWVKLANTLKLRLLIRQSQINANPTAELAKIQANGLLGSGESAQVTIGYTNDLNKQNPFYATYGFKPDGNSANDIERANNYILGILKTNNDARLAYFFRPATSPTSATDPFIGTTYGAAPSAATEGPKTSNIGPGLTKSFSQPQWILTSVESMFLQAEAVARGWLPGTAQTAYENAVRESYIWLGVTNAVATANTYLSTVTTANYANAGATVDSRVKFIVYQKYIALTGINALEAYNDYRRLNVPSNLPITVNPARVSTVIPIRFLYPSAEFSVNAANVPKGVSQFTTAIFWDK